MMADLEAIAVVTGADSFDVAVIGTGSFDVDIGVGSIDVADAGVGSNSMDVADTGTGSIDVAFNLAAGEAVSSTLGSGSKDGIGTDSGSCELRFDRNFSVSGISVLFELHMSVSGSGLCLELGSIDVASSTSGSEISVASCGSVIEVSLSTG